MRFSTRFSPKVRWFAAVLILGTAISAVTLFLLEDRSALSLRQVKANVIRAEDISKQNTARSLKSISGLDQSSLAHVSVSNKSINELLAAFNGMTYHDAKTGADLILLEVHADFQPGFPKLRAAFMVSASGVTLNLRAWAALQPSLDETGVVLRLTFLALEPDAALPRALKSIVSAETVALLNAQIQPFQAPLPQSFTFVGEVKPPEDFWVPTPNGKILLHLNVPPPPTLVVNWSPAAAYFDKDGLHVIGQVSTTGPISRHLPSPATLESFAVADETLDALLVPWRIREGHDYTVRIPQKPILEFLIQLNQLPEPKRSATVSGVKAEGHIMEKTGGLPFGNGFQAWLEGPERLQVRVVLSNFQPRWREGIALQLTATASASGTVQVHVHGNPPRIKKRIDLGLFSWKVIDVEVGGGVGSSVGASADARGDITAALTYHSSGHLFAVQIESPDRLHAKVNIGGVPDDLEHWFNAGFDVALPKGQDLYRFKIPDLINPAIEIRALSKISLKTKTLHFALPSPDVKFSKEAVEIVGSLNITSE